LHEVSIMRWLLTALALAAALLGAVAPGTASAHGYGRWSVGVGFGWPGYWGGGWGGYWPGSYAPYYGSPYYGYGPVVTTAPEPTSYIERDDAQPKGRAENSPRRDWWYYCPESKTYYPYVKQCEAGWQRVEPKPEGER
jgi:hypothetical protein